MAEDAKDNENGAIDGPADVVAEAKDRFERAKDYYGPARILAIADTQFAMGDSDNGWQWPAAIRQGRVVDQRVCLTVNMTAQHCNQIINNIRQNRPQARVLPADSGADKKTAEILGGLIRNIQVASSADDAHDLAAEHAVYGGEGYWRIVTDYETPSSFNQVIKIKLCSNPQLVFIDDTCQELDKSDAEWGFVFEDISKEQCKREYPDIEPADWGDTDNSGWVSKDTVRRAEYFYCTYKDDTALLLSNGADILKSELDEQDPGGAQLSAAGITIQDQRPTKTKHWKWCKLVGGHDKPVDTRDWKGQYLPIIAVVGKELNVNGEIVRKGIVRDLKDPARMVNYSYSETIQTVALQNKIPYIAASEAIEGYEDNWKNANSSNAAYLPYNALDDDGNALPKPERQQPAVVPAAQVQLLQVSTEQMRAASGQQNANFGIKSEAASGVGIQRLKVQGETATFHFPDNLRRALQYEAKVLIDLIQNYYDTKRVVRILGLDGKEEKAQLDPQAQGYQEVNGETTEQDVQHIFNPLVGQYDVVIDTGPSFQTQRQEGFTMLSDIASRNPQLMQIAGDLIMRNADIPGAQEIADRMEKTLPPNLQDDKKQAAQMGQQLQQLQQKDQQHQMVIGKMQEHIDKLELDAKGKVIDNQGKAEIERIKQRTDAAQGVADHSIGSFDAITRRMQVVAPAMTPQEIQALVMQTVQEALSNSIQDSGPPALPPDPQPMQVPDQAPQGAFSLPAQPPEMAATGAQPGLGAEPNLSEGPPNV